jgi:hypothetical protein
MKHVGISPQHELVCADPLTLSFAPSGKAMSARYTFTCNLCDFSLDAWDDGNPYIEYPTGTRQYIYHPGESQKIAEIAEAILGREPTEDDCSTILQKYAGNEPDHICRACHKVIRIDREKDPCACHECGAEAVELVEELGGKRCVHCDGVFSDGRHSAIS